MRNKILLLFIVIVTVLFYYAAPETKSLFFISTAVVISILVLFGHYFFNDGSLLRRKFFHPSLLFIIPFYIVSFQFIIDFLLKNLIEEDLKDIFSSFQNTNRAIAISLMAFTSLIAGYGFSKKDRMKSSKQVILNKKIPSLFTFLALISFILFLYFVGTEFLSGKYQDTSNWNRGSAWFHKFFELFLFSAYVYKIGINRNKIDSIKSYLKFLGFPIIVITFLYLTIFGLIGDRGPMLTFITLFLCSYFYLTRAKIKFVPLISLLLIITVTFNFIGFFRNKDETNLLNAFINREQVKSISPNTYELAGSIKPLSIAIETVPKVEPYRYGMFQFNQIMVAFPGLFGIYFEAIGFDTKQDSRLLDSANYLTNIYLGKYSSWGIGTNPVADIYLDFGPIGVCISFFLFGIFLKKLDNNFHKNRITMVSLIILFMYSSRLVYLSRSTLLTPVSDIIQLLLIYFIISLFSSKRNESTLYSRELEFRRH